MLLPGSGDNSYEPKGDGLLERITALRGRVAIDRSFLLCLNEADITVTEIIVTKVTWYEERTLFQNVKKWTLRPVYHPTLYHKTFSRRHENYSLQTSQIQQFFPSVVFHTFKPRCYGGERMMLFE